MEVESGSDRVPQPVQPQARNEAVVKVFIIENAEGNWLDCGAGTLQFVCRQKGGIFRESSLGKISQKDLGIQVTTSLKDNHGRDFIDPARERKLKNNIDDASILLELNLEQSKEFAKCQCSFGVSSHHHFLGAD